MRNEMSSPPNAYLRHYLTGRPTSCLIDDLPSLERLEEDYIHYVLELTGSDVVRASEILNISPGELLYKLKKLDIWL